MAKFYGYIQPKIDWLYDQADKNWEMVAAGETMDLARENTLSVIRERNRGSKNPTMYVVYVRTHVEVVNARD